MQTVLFQAEEPGRYVLAYGGTARTEARRTRAFRLPPTSRLLWLEAGHRDRAFATPAAGRGHRPRRPRWGAAGSPPPGGWWPRPRSPGFLVRLELPDVVYRAARADLGEPAARVRRASDPLLPLVAGRARARGPAWDLDPTGSSRRSRRATWEIRLPESRPALDGAGPPGSARPMRRAVGVRYPEPAGEAVPRRENGKRRNRPARRPPDLGVPCPQPPLPCHERLPLPGHAPQVLSVRFHDGDNPPLADLEAAVWRRRDVLLFVWPEGEETAPVRLLAGPETLEAPSYDLAALGETLLEPSLAAGRAEPRRGRRERAPVEPLGDAGHPGDRGDLPDRAAADGSCRRREVC